MLKVVPKHMVGDFVGVGSYTAKEAARLLKVRPRNVNRWLGGYNYKNNDQAASSPPLWSPEICSVSGKLELSFRDLIELRFVSAFVDAGVGMKAIRNCLRYARECVDDARPFSTLHFRTDGKTIFLESLQDLGDTLLLDLRRGQYVIKRVIEQTFRDLDIEQDAVVRWRPFQGKRSIIIDPDRAFGQPIIASAGIPTIVLADSFAAEGSIEAVSKLFEVPAAQVRDAVEFEKTLMAA